MTRQLSAITGVLALCLVVAGDASAQRSRASVSAGEVNGTFRQNFDGRFRGNYSEIKILAMGRGRLKMEFGLTYPFVDGTGNLSANVGNYAGTADIKGDTAIFTSDESPSCRIEIKFVRPGTIKVAHLSDVSACGYGHNVTAAGIYKKISSKKPEFGSGQ